MVKELGKKGITVKDEPGVSLVRLFGPGVGDEKVFLTVCITRILRHYHLRVCKTPIATPVPAADHVGAPYYLEMERETHGLGGLFMPLKRRLWECNPDESSVQKHTARPAAHTSDLLHSLSLQQYTAAVQSGQ